MRWSAALVISLGLVVTGCPSDDDDSAGDDDTVVDVCQTGSPTVSIDQPSNGATFGDGETINFQAQVADDNDPPASLAIHWTDKVAGVEEDLQAPGPNASGVIVFQSADFETGTHILTLNATDSDGCVGSEDTSFAVGQ